MPQIPRLIAVTETTWENASQLTRHLCPFVFDLSWLKMGTATHDTREQDDFCPSYEVDCSCQVSKHSSAFLPLKPIQNFNGLIATSNQFG